MRTIVVFIHTSLDDFWLMANPVLLSSGAALVAGIPERTALQAVSNSMLPSGVVCCLHVAPRDVG